MSSRERNMLILLGVVVVAAGAFFLLTMGGGEPEQEAAPTPAPSPPVVTSPEPGTGTTGRPPRTFRFFGGRDPFVPLVVAAPGGGGAGTAPAETAPGDQAAPTDGAAPTGEPPVGEPPIEEPPPDAEQQQADGAQVGGKRVVLIDIFTANGERVAQVEVDGTTFVVSEGERFARNFELVSIEGNCARFLFGDQSFTLCEGERPK